MVAEGTHKHFVSGSIIVNESSPVIDQWIWTTHNSSFDGKEPCNT